MSKAPDAANASTTVETQGDTVTFNLGLPKVVDESSRLDDTHNLPQWDAPDISTFLARPTRLVEVQWQANKHFYNSGVPTTFLNSETSGYQIDPWSLLLSSAPLRHKLDQFAYLQADLHLKFVMTASAHHYGSLRCAYVPFGGNYSVCGRTDRCGNSHYATYLLCSSDALTNCGNTGLAGITSPTMTSAFDTYLSTFPGVQMQPGDVEVAELVIPFHSHKDWIDLVDTTNRSLGVLHMKSQTILRTVSSTASQVLSVTVYGWFDKVKVKGSTFYTTSSTRKFKKTEVRTDGPISAPASAIADMAGKLSSVPIIGPMARATEMGAGAVGDIAKLFGYCAPADISAPTKVRIDDWCELAPCNRARQEYVLSADAQAETTVDPAIAGLGSEDQMAFSYICSKPCLISQPVWKVSTTTASSTGQYASGTTAQKDVLFVAPVTPLYSRLGAENVSGAGQNYLGFFKSVASPGVSIPTPEVGDWDVMQQTASYTAFRSACWQPTPNCHVARLFHYWRGTICFKIEVVASKFHAGTIMLAYDPQDDTLSSTSNLRVSKIVDISETKEIYFEIPWCSARSYLEVDPCSNFANGTVDGAMYEEPVRDPTYISGTTLYQNFWPNQPSQTTWDTIDSNNFLKTLHADGHFFDKRVHNGVFTISIVNDLLASSTASIGSNSDVQLLVWSWGKDMEFAVPSGRWYGDTYSPYPRFGSTWNSTSQSLVFMGEKVSSSRQLVKRDTLAMTCFERDNTKGYYEINVPFYPISPKTTYTYLNNAAMWTNATTPAVGYADVRKVCHNTVINYMAQCYMGMRGGMRYRFVHVTDGATAGSTNNASNQQDLISNRRIEFTTTYPPAGGGGYVADRYFGYRKKNNVGYRYLNQTAVNTAFYPSATTYVRSAGDSSVLTTFAQDSIRANQKNAVIAVPYQQTVRFRIPMFLRDNVYPFYTDFTDPVEQVVQAYISNVGSQSNYGIDVYVAAAEDFNLLWFLAAPPIFRAMGRY